MPSCSMCYAILTEMNTILRQIQHLCFWDLNYFYSLHFRLYFLIIRMIVGRAGVEPAVFLMWRIYSPLTSPLVISTQKETSDNAFRTKTLPPVRKENIPPIIQNNEHFTTITNTPSGYLHIRNDIQPRYSCNWAYEPSFINFATNNNTPVSASSEMVIWKFHASFSIF